MTDHRPVPGQSAFEARLVGIMNRSETEGEQQSALLLLLVREIHTIKWILWWVLIIVPAIVLVLGIVLIHTSVPTPITTSGF